MKESTRKRIVYALLVGAVIFGLIMKPWESAPKDRTRQPVDEQPPPPATVVAASITSDQPQTEFVREWSRDPFATQDMESEIVVPEIQQIAAVPSGEYLLQGILVAGGEPACVLNGMTLLVGDMIEDWRVEYIGSSEVLLVRDSENKCLVLP